MNEVLAERIRRRLETLPEDKLYQVLDYIEFLESRFATRSAGAPPFQKVAEALEDTMRAGRVPLTVIKGTMDVVGKAGKLVEGLAAAGRAAVHDMRRKAEEKPTSPTSPVPEPDKPA